MRISFSKSALVVALFYFSLGTPFIRATLKWETPLIEQTAAITENSAVTVFRFKNDGPKTETITSVQPSCSCTKVKLAKEVYAPGESGEIRATMDFDDRIGMQEKNLEVFTLNGPSKPDVLTWRVTIPEKVTATPRMLWWEPNGPTEIATVITAVAPAKIDAVSIDASSLQEISARIETIERGKTYRLILKPLATTPPVRAVVPCLITYTNAAPSHTVFYAFKK